MAKFSLSLVCLALVFSVCHARSVTYPLIGTFTDNDFYDPTWRPFVMLPQSPEHINPTFTLYNRNLMKDGQILIWKDEDSMRNSKFDPKIPTKIVVHGLLDNVKRGHWLLELKDRFIELANLNVIVIDWRHGDNLPYTRATANTRVVGAMAGVLIEKLCKVFNITPDSFHFLGHSLGAHIAGYAGKRLNGTLGHITGFDPAGPYYEGLKDTRARLWHTDAKFVESIHTDATHLIPNLGFGMYETCSHVDFYPNGGQSQPGCDQERFTSIITKGLIEGARRLVACNHQRSVDFYIESIINPESVPKAYACSDYDSFQAGKCSSCGSDGSDCAILGPKTIDYKKFIKDLSKSTGKRFFMVTGPHEKQFFKFQYLVKVNMGPESTKYSPEHGKIELKFDNWNGDSQKVDFNQVDQIFHYGTNYSRVIVSDIDPTQLDDIKVSFSHGSNIMKWTVYIDSIEITPLSSKDETKSLGTHKFISNNHVITNKNEVVFKRED